MVFIGVDLSVPEEKKKTASPLKKISKFLLSFSRKAGFLTVSLFLRWPIWLSLWLLKIVGLKFFSYLFLVYPGTDADLDGYCPRWLAKSWIFSKKPTVGGIISKGSGGRGLTLVVPNTVQEFHKNRDVCEKTMKRLEWIKNLAGAKSIAIAGQVPGMLVRHGIDIDQPFVRGNKGTVFCIVETIERVMRKKSLITGKFQIALLGVGYVGRVLMNYLETKGHQVIGIDISINRQGVKLQSEAPEVLRHADMIVVLTPKGSDFMPYSPFIKRGSVVIDDTHPKIRQRLKGVEFYKVAVGMDGVNFYPRLPGYRSDWIPGCAVEAIVSAATTSFNGHPQRIFNQKARDLGFFAHLVS